MLNDAIYRKTNPLLSFLFCIRAEITLTLVIRDRTVGMGRYFGRSWVG